MREALLVLWQLPQAIFGFLFTMCCRAHEVEDRDGILVIRSERNCVGFFPWIVVVPWFASTPELIEQGTRYSRLSRKFGPLYLLVALPLVVDVAYIRLQQLWWCAMPFDEHFLKLPFERLVARLLP